MPRCSSSNNQPTTINDEHRRQTVPAAVFVFDSVALSDWLDRGDNITYLLLRDCVVVEYVTCIPVYVCLFEAEYIQRYVDDT